MLLVLDNFEQLISASSPAVALVADLLAECPGLCLLVTSRERLHLRAEQRYQVQPLALAAAVDLFVQRCAAVDAEFALTAANRPTIEAICEQVDRLPLALELCAAQIDLLSLSATPGGPARSPARPAGGRRAGFAAASAHVAQGHRAELRPCWMTGSAPSSAAWASSWVGVGWRRSKPSAHGTQKMSGRALLATLHALIGKSLVRVETMPGGAGRFLLLETIREFALEQARAEGEEELLRQRHFAAYLQLFRTADRRLRGPEAAAWLARLEPEQDNLRAALQWTLDERRYADMAWLVLAVAWFWFHTGRWQESARWTARLWSHREALDADVRLAILINLYRVSRASEEFQPVDRYAD